MFSEPKEEKVSDFLTIKIVAPNEDNVPIIRPATNVDDVPIIRPATNVDPVPVIRPATNIVEQAKNVPIIRPATNVENYYIDYSDDLGYAWVQ